jgi:hypothetical protein
MPSILVRLELPHMQELFRRFGPLERIEEQLPTEVVPDGDVFFDPGQYLDRWVHRCIGTTTELEDLEQRGGAVLLAYPDGSMRAIRIDTSRDGMSLSERSLEPPPILQSGSRRRRRGRRFSL